MWHTLVAHMLLAIALHALLVLLLVHREKKEISIAVARSRFQHF
jgi:hypothetical protein